MFPWLLLPVLALRGGAAAELGRTSAPPESMMPVESLINLFPRGDQVRPATPPAGAGRPPAPSPAPRVLYVMHDCTAGLQTVSVRSRSTCSAPTACSRSLSRLRLPAHLHPPICSALYAEYRLLLPAGAARHPELGDSCRGRGGQDVLVQR